MPTYRYWLRDAGISSSKLTTSTALASLMSGRGYSVRMLHPLSGEYTTQGSITPGMLDHDPYPSIKNGVPYLEMDGWVYGLVGDTQINSKQRPVTFSGPAHASLNGRSNSASSAMGERLLLAGCPRARSVAVGGA